MISSLWYFCKSADQRVGHHHDKTGSYSVTSRISYVYVVVVVLFYDIITISSYLSCRLWFCYYIERWNIEYFFCEKLFLYFLCERYFSFYFFSMYKLSFYIFECIECFIEKENNIVYMRVMCFWYIDFLIFHSSDEKFFYIVFQVYNRTFIKILDKPHNKVCL